MFANSEQDSLTDDNLNGLWWPDHSCTSVPSDATSAEDNGRYWHDLPAALAKENVVTWSTAAGDLSDKAGVRAQRQPPSKNGHEPNTSLLNIRPR